MPSRFPAIFLDDGGVLNDNALRPPQWQRLVGEFLAPRLGGSHRDWADANSVVADQVLNEFSLRADKNPEADYREHWDSYRESWLIGMCEKVGVTVPAADILPLAGEAISYVTRRVHAAFPGVVDAIRQLRADGHRLYTASAENSAELEGYLEAMRVRGMFTELYGPDLVNTLKSSDLYYRRVFDDAGVDPVTAIVVDDSPRAVPLASEAGACAVLVSGDPSVDLEVAEVIGGLAELPQLLRGGSVR